MACARLACPSSQPAADRAELRADIAEVDANIAVARLAQLMAGPVIADGRPELPIMHLIRNEGA